MSKIYNIVGFQVSWWACVLGVKYGMPYIGPAIMLIFLLIHFFFFSIGPHELKLVFIFALFGTLIDSFFAFSNMLSYKGTYAPDLLIAPLWITAMWCGFCSTVNHSLAWLKNRWVSAFLLGAIFGPLSYITGQKFGAIYFNSDLVTVNTILALVWGLSIPLIYWVNERLVSHTVK